MDQKALNAAKVGFICGVALVLYTLLAYGITAAIFTEMTRQPTPADGSTPIPRGNLSEGMTALIIDFIMLTIGSMFILAAGGALFARMSRDSLSSIRETIKWSAITGIFSFIAYVIICVVLVIVSAIISIILSHDLSKAFGGTIPGAASTMICCFPITAIAWVLGLMAAVIGGFACATFVLKQS